MNVKNKLTTILNRILYVLREKIRAEHNQDYSKGFEHATKLFSIAIDKEFKKYIQIEENKNLIIKSLLSEIEKKDNKIFNQKRQLRHSEKMLEQERENIRLSKNKTREIVRSICEHTGRNPEEVRTELLGILKR